MTTTIKLITHGYSSYVCDPSVLSAFHLLLLPSFPLDSGEGRGSPSLRDALTQHPGSGLVHSWSFCRDTVHAALSYPVSTGDSCCPAPCEESRSTWLPPGLTEAVSTAGQWAPFFLGPSWTSFSRSEPHRLRLSGPAPQCFQDSWALDQVSRS